jgi:hypothetical protein
LAPVSKSALIFLSPLGVSMVTVRSSLKKIRDCCIHWVFRDPVEISSS